MARRVLASLSQGSKNEDQFRFESAGCCCHGMLLSSVLALDPPHEICEWSAALPVEGGKYRGEARSVVVLIAG